MHTRIRYRRKGWPDRGQIGEDRMFTEELSNKITELFIERGIPVEGEFFTWTNFNELNSGDLVCLPMNLRAGVYEIGRASCRERV